MDAWDQGFHTLAKIIKQNFQKYYSSLGISIQLKWKYLQRNFAEVENRIELIEMALGETFFPTIFRGGGDVD